MDGWTLSGLALGAVGLSAVIAARWLPVGDWARALLVTAVAVIVSGFAWRDGGAPLAWVSGFLACAALHRWIEAAASHAPPARGKRRSAKGKQ